MKLFWILLALITNVFADLHNVALKALATSPMCGNKTLTKLREQIMNTSDTVKFDNYATCHIGGLTRNEKLIDYEIVFESVLAFLSDSQSPMCHYLADENIDSWSTFITALFDAFENHPQLENFAAFAFFPEHSTLMRYYFWGKQVELARFFISYSKHSISKKYSFKFILNKFLYSKLRLYSCPELQERLNALFSLDSFKQRVERIATDKEMLCELLFNHLFNDGPLMSKVFDFLMEENQLGTELKFKSYFMMAASLPNYYEFARIIFCNALLNFGFDMKKIQQFVEPLIHSQAEWDEFAQLLICKYAIRSLNSSEEFEVAKFSEKCNEIFWYIEDIFKGPNLKDVAENVIRHLERVEYAYQHLSPVQAWKWPEIAKKFVARIVQVYGIDTDEIEQEFSDDMEKSYGTREKDHQF